MAKTIARRAIDPGPPERARHGIVRPEHERTRKTVMRVRDMASCPIDLLLLKRRLSMAQHATLNRFRKDWEDSNLTDVPRQKWDVVGWGSKGISNAQVSASEGLRIAMGWLVKIDRRLAKIVWRVVIDEQMPLRPKALAYAADRLMDCYDFQEDGKLKPFPDPASLFAPALRVR